jgi:hypothetical protein
MYLSLKNTLKNALLRKNRLKIAIFKAIFKIFKNLKNRLKNAFLSKKKLKNSVNNAFLSK